MNQTDRHSQFSSWARVATVARFLLPKCFFAHKWTTSRYARFDVRFRMVDLLRETDTSLHPIRELSRLEVLDVSFQKRTSDLRSLRRFSLLLALVSTLWDRQAGFSPALSSALGVTARSNQSRFRSATRGTFSGGPIRKRTRRIQVSAWIYSHAQTFY